MCIVSIGACVRLGLAIDERDRMARQLLDRVNDTRDTCLLHGLWLPERPLLSPRQRRAMIIRQFLRGTQLPSEAYPLEKQAQCLERCAVKKWVVWNDVSLHAGKYRDYSLTLTPAGLEKLIDLRLLLPTVIPAARLHSR